jgi:hypothetical protein
VVLTPLKPPTKSSISGEAINSSLYYLHVATEDDEYLLRSVESDLEQQHQESPSQEGHEGSRLSEGTISQLNSFHRKPIRQQPGEPDAPHPPPHREGVANYIHSGDGPIRRRPVTHSLHDPSPTDPSARQQVANSQTEPSSAERGGPSTWRFSIPRRPVTGSHGSQIGLQTGRTPPPVGTSPTDTRWDRTTDPGQKETTDSTFCITLIRRDPASNGQWNVGTISGFNGDKSKTHIEINTPGYGKFINNSEPLSLARLGLNLPGGNGPEQSPALSLSIPASSAPTTGMFSRELSAVKHSSRSDEVTHEAESTNLGPLEPKLAKLAPAKPSRGYYTFASPWNGTCTFVASVNGRSLKCKHTIPGPAMSAGAESGRNAAATVAELRFNIPFPLDGTARSPIFNLPKDKSKRGALAHMISSNIQRVQQHARSRSRTDSDDFAMDVPRHSGSSSEDNLPSAAAVDQDRLDLSLAKELAGGGMSGKSAKLGKLIIEDEGIKMMDLVVAACMGVWWRSSHRS